jgi:hypothetical protein
MFAGDEWQSGSYGLPRPKSGCPSGKNGWREGWRYQDMEDSRKNTSERSRVSSGSRMGVTLVGNKKKCKQDILHETKYWNTNKVLA